VRDRLHIDLVDARSSACQEQGRKPGIESQCLTAEMHIALNIFAFLDDKCVAIRLDNLEESFRRWRETIVTFCDQKFKKFL
jgi:hypothetical protein